jgi:glycosyltransferase involved in cell wall biosynthesis
MLENYSPKISIIIPMYNRATLVGETLDSVLAQTYTDWECIVVDDGSTDNSVEVVQKYVDKDSRFKLLIRPEDRIKGAPTCRNIGYENSKGEYIYFFDSDDILATEFLKTVYEKMNETPTAEYGVFQFSDFIETPDIPVRLSRRYNPKAGSLFSQIITYKIQANTQNFFWRRSLLQKNLLMWREGLSCSQDPDFVCRTICHADKGIWLNIPCLVYVRKHSQSIGQESTYNTDIRTQVLKFIFDYCVDTGKMTPTLYSMYLRTILRLQIVQSVLLGKKKLVYHYSILLRNLSRQNINDFLLIFLSNILLQLTPIIFICGYFLKKYRSVCPIKVSKHNFYNMKKN